MDKIPLRLLISVVAVLGSPVAVIFLLISAMGWIAPAPAWGSLAACLILIALIVRPHLADLIALRNFAAALAEGKEPVLPPANFGALAEILGPVISRLGRRKNDRQEADDLIQVIFEQLPDPLFLLDREARVLRANRAAKGLFGPSLEGRPLAAFLRNPRLTAAAEAVLNGADGQHVDFFLTIPVERAFRAWIAPLWKEPRPKAEGGTVMALLRLYDETSEKRTETLHADFIANVSHELKTPLAALSGYIETLQGGAREDPKAREKFLEIMHEQALRMQRLVEDLMSLSQIERQAHKAPAEPVDMDKVIRNAAELVRPKAEAKRQDIIIEGGGMHAIGDRDQILQVFLNLLDNAIKYGRPQTPVRVRIARQKQGGRDCVSVAVSDEGEGIPAEHLPRLTERFYRVDAARSRELGGTGLGLAIVKHIVARHRGELVIASAPGRGSAFTVFLPESTP